MKVPNIQKILLNGEIAILANEIDEDNRNAVIRECDQTVGNDMQPDDSRVPQVAETVRHEIGGKQLLEDPHQSLASLGSYRQWLL
jgi:hypothetical protein